MGSKEKKRSKSPAKQKEENPPAPKETGDTKMADVQPSTPVSDGRPRKRTKDSETVNKDNTILPSQVTPEFLLNHEIPAIRQGALKGILGKLVADTKLTKSDIRKVAKELLPPSVTAPAEATPKEGKKKKGKKQKGKKPSPATVAKRKELADLEKDTTKYPLSEREGKDTPYSCAKRAIRARYKTQAKAPDEGKQKKS